ncbi:MAG: hypothetical protein N2510_09750, partial [Ignavibacteria bacterium]|nr:hypothetical protein [Ignavibacteria bacterium]
PMAAALMVKRDWINKYGAMDERFEMFFNDVDLCKRIYDTGFRIRLIADAGLTHLHGASVRRERIRMIKIWSRDCIEYFTKHKPSAINLIWLKLFLKISGFFRITYYRIKKV